MFDEDKLMDNQTDRLAEVIEKKMNTRAYRGQNQQNTPYKPEVEITDIIQVMTEFMTETNILDTGYMTEIEESIMHAEADPEAIINQEGHMGDKTTIEIEMTVDSNGSGVDPDHQLEHLELDQCHSAEISIDASVGDNLVMLPKKDTSSSKMQHREERTTKHKECPHLYDSNPEEEEVIAAMCYSGETTVPCK